MTAAEIGIIYGLLGALLLFVFAWAKQQFASPKSSPGDVRKPWTGGCPFCGNESASPVHHVAWGGIIAPRVYRLVQCGGCGTRYSARNGRHEKELLRGYLTGVLVVALLVAGGVIAYMAFQ